MDSVADAFVRAYDSMMEIGFRQDAADASRMKARREAEALARIRQVLGPSRPQPVAPPNTSLSTAGDPNSLPLDDSGPMGAPTGMEPGGQVSAAQPVPAEEDESGSQPPSAFPDAAEVAGVYSRLAEAAGMSGDLKGYRQLMDAAVGMRKTAAEIDITELEKHRDVAAAIGSLAGGATDEASAYRAIMIANSLHLPTEGLFKILQEKGWGPETQAAFEQTARSGLSVKDQYSAQIAASKLQNDNLRTKATLDKKEHDMLLSEQRLALSREVASDKKGRASLTDRLLSLVEGVQKPAEDKWTKPLENEIQKKIVASSDQMADLRAIQSELRPEFFTVWGIASDYIRWAKSKLGLDLTPEQAERHIAQAKFNRKAMAYRLAKIREFTGLASSAKQDANITLATFDTWAGDPVAMEAQIKDIVHETRNSLIRYQIRAKSGNDPLVMGISAQDTSGLMKMYIQMQRQEYKSRTDWSDAQINAQVQKDVYTTFPEFDPAKRGAQ